MRTGLEAARSAGDITGQAHCLHRLAVGYTRSGRFHDAAAPSASKHCNCSKRQATSSAQPTSTECSGSWPTAEQSDTPALGHLMRALDVYRAADHPGQAMVLNDIGYAHALLGNYPQALACCEQALAVIRELGARELGECRLGQPRLRLSPTRRSPQAITCYQRSLDLSRELADRWNEAATLDHLGDTYASAGDTAAAHRAWLQSLRMFDEIDHPDGDSLPAKLRLAGPRLPVRRLTHPRPTTPTCHTDLTGIRLAGRRACSRPPVTTSMLH